MDPDPTYEAIEAFLLNGRPRRSKRGSRVPVQRGTPVTDPALLDPYERLLHDHARHLSKEELTVAVFSWAMAGFDYEEAREWLAAGAGLHDRPACEQFRTAGITVEEAFAPLMKHGRPSGETLFDLVSSRRMTARTALSVVERWRLSA